MLFVGGGYDKWLRNESKGFRVREVTHTWLHYEDNNMIYTSSEEYSM